MSISDPAAWVSEYGDYLYRYALTRVRDATAAEDLVQETLLSALKARNGFSGRSSVRTWLTGILKHKIIDHLYRSRDGIQVEDIELLADENAARFDATGHWSPPPGDWAGPETALERDEFWAVFEKCLGHLPPRLSQLFLLKEIDGLTAEDLCKALGISTTNNAWVMLSRARLRLRDCLEAHWFGERSKGDGQ